MICPQCGYNSTPQTSRKLKHIKAVKWVSRHEHLWNEPFKLVEGLKRDGLYSQKTYNGDIRTDILIAEAKVLVNE